ncbi:trehalose-phosphatase [Brevundimonas subvibrioides]|uniref:Trehalose 6-phosphate phosphatase n=1 Tax=Brevundimonas subvibrioides (strain ATCC 15264 / DSM 4735 / LMG 14903 / NBRC 16000 / CB 81) TaxID=633149 RepID=D9QLY6_BRESC|nr:trehalose-phosphatase [Brevundimonas subvibrioides]ADL00070.1 trehalose-phosphatase [Brevundimonas subvibrioides ATCC 15264]
MPSNAGTLIPCLPQASVHASAGLALFLDLDGVLAPMASTPDAVVADPRRTRILQTLDRALDGRLAVISGRTLSEIDRITGGAARSAAGVHGLQRRRRDGSTATIEPSAGVAAAVEAFRAFAETHPGMIVEDKGVSAGLHYRAVPHVEAEALALADVWAERAGLVAQPGKLVVELKTPGADKGTALTAFMGEPAFADTMPVMLGDDLTDEAGFVAAEALGGFGILVGAPRETAARYGLADVEAVLTWLEAVAMEAQPA